jgi:signal transduction histidine kinase
MASPVPLQGEASVPTDYLERLEFLQLEVSDAALLAELGDRYEAVAEQLEERFYRHLLATPRTRALLDEATLGRLKHSQRAYFQRMLGGEYGRSYAEGRFRAGAAHQRVGLEPAWFIGAHALHVRLLLPLLFAHAGPDPTRLLALLEALVKVIFLDLGLGIDSYIAAKDRDVQRFREVADLLVESVPVGLVLLDSHLRVLSANRAFVEAHGRRDALPRRPLPEVLGAPALGRHLVEVRESGTKRTGILLDVRFNGVSRPARLAVARLDRVDVDGARLACVVESLADEARLAERLRHAERRYQESVAQCSDALALLRPDGGIRLFNRAAEELSGYVCEEVVGRPLFALVGEADRAAVTDGLARCGMSALGLPDRGHARRPDTTEPELAADRAPLAAHGELTLRVELVRPDGVRRPIDLQLRAEMIDGEVALVALLRDQARRSDEAAQRPVDATLHAAMESDTAFLVLHRAGEVLQAGAGAAARLGYPDAAALRGRQLLDLVAVPDRAAMAPTLAGDAGVGVFRVVRFVHRSGGPVVVRLTALPHVVGGETAQLLVGEEHAAPSALVTQMGHLVPAGSLATGVACEMTAPLEGLAAALQLLERDLGPMFVDGDASAALERARAALGQARRSAADLADLRSRLAGLCAAPTETGVLVDVRDVLGSMIRLTRHEIGARAALATELGAVPLVEADEAALAQVFLALLLNAARAIPAGAPERNEVRVRTYHAAGEALVEVRDSGPEIPLDRRSRLLDPADAPAASGEMAGVGLAVAQRIVASFGGVIEAESQAGGGSTFRVRLPGARVFSAETAESPTLVSVAPPTAAHT